MIAHIAVAHLMKEYFDYMDNQPGWSMARFVGKCPSCSYQYGIGEPPTPSVAKTRDILLVKHFALIHLPISTLMNSNKGPSHRPLPKLSPSPVQTASKPDFNLEKADISCIYCKFCKQLCAKKVNNGCVILLKICTNDRQLDPRN